ncbi:Nickel/cobalt efflux system RcnA [Linum perenne]
MTDLSHLLQQSSAHAWLFVPSAILLGALHGLEPGHSKTMMAAFIIAVRGTVLQAVLLGLSATISHTAIVWAVALAGLHFGQELSGERSEAWLQLTSAVIIVGIAGWMVWRTWRARDGYLESIEEIPEPHAFKARVALAGDSTELLFEEHEHDHIDLGDEDDAHARAHAADIRKRFAGRTVTTTQIVLFGLTGGLIPCPAAITVLLLCIQLKQFSLGFVLVLSFGIGLAITMVSAGVLAALSLRHVERHWSGFSRYAHRAPYVSAALIVFVGLYTGWTGLHALMT